MHVLTNSALFHAINSFVDGVPYHVLQFQKNDPFHGILVRVNWCRQSTKLWEAAVRCGNRRVFKALKVLATVPRCRDNPHV